MLILMKKMAKITKGPNMGSEVKTALPLLQQMIKVLLTEA